MTTSEAYHAALIELATSAHIFLEDDNSYTKRMHASRDKLKKAIKAHHDELYAEVLRAEGWLNKEREYKSEGQVNREADAVNRYELNKAALNKFISEKPF